MIAAKNGDTGTAKVLLNAGADVRVKDKGGHNALWYASQNKDLPVGTKKILTDMLWDAMSK